MRIRFEQKGDFKRTDKFLSAMQRREMFKRIDSVCSQGVKALADATPKESGLTASSWDYQIKMSRGGVSIDWTNSNVNQGIPIAILLQYGHGTGTGGYVPGRDYINPAMRPVFDKIADSVWRVVTSA